MRRISPEIPNEKNGGQNRGGVVPRISSARVRPGRRRPAGQVRVRRCASNSLSRSVRLKASCVQHGRRARIFLTPARARLSLRSSRLSRGWPLDERQPFNKCTGLDGLVSRRSLVSARRTVDGPSSLVFTSPRPSKGRSSVSAHPRTARGGCRITPSRCCVLQFLARGCEINGVHAAARFPRGRVPRARAGTRRVLSQRRRVAGGRTHRAPPRGPARRGRRLRGERARVRPLGWGQGARCRGVRGNR